MLCFLPQGDHEEEVVASLQMLMRNSLRPPDQTIVPQDY